MILLRRGDRSSLVRLMQERLNAHGLNLGVDGVFGPTTERVLIDFQVIWNLVSDGICGDVTWSCLLQQRGMNRGDARLRRSIPKTIYGIVEAKGGSEWGLRLCKRALEDLGKEESPWGKNRGAQISRIVQGSAVTGVVDLEFSEYKRHWGIGGTTHFPPWCAIAVSSWLAECFGCTSWGEIPFGNWFGGVTQTMKWGDETGHLRRGVGECEAGELFVMPRAGSGSDGDDGDGARIRGGHIGIILWDDGERIQTVEGNTQNGVRTRSRLKSSLWGVVDWEGSARSRGWEPPKV